MDLKKTQKREMRVQEVPTSNESREVLIAFSSETPVIRCINGRDYNEILLHTPEAADLTRLRNGAALLFNHDLNQHIGIVEDANIDSDKVGRALVRFSSVGIGDEKYLQVKEGVLRKVSVGYEINDYQIDGDNLIVTNWAPYEISMVSVPADDFVGVGRALDESTEDDEVSEEEQTQDTEIDESTDEVQPETEEVPEENNSTEEDVESEERIFEDESDSTDEVEEVTEEDQSEVSELINKQEEQRIAELNGMARVLKIDVSEAIANGISVEEFKKTRQSNNVINNKDVKNMEFSLKNTVRSMLAGDSSEALEMGDRGIIVPNAALRVTTATSAALIQETIKYDSYCDVLRAASVLAKLPVQVISGLEGNGEISIPVLANDYVSSSGFVDEDTEADTVDPTVNSVLLKPRDWSTKAYITRLTQKSSSAVERIVQDSLVKGSASNIERKIMAQVVADAVAAGSNTDVTALTDITYDVIIDAIAALGNNNVSSQNIVCVVSPNTRAALRKAVIKNNTAAKFVIEGTGEDMLLVNEVPVLESTLIADGVVALGDWSYVVLAQWGSLIEIDRDDTTARNKGGVYIRGWATLNFTVTRPEAFHVIRVGA